MILAGEAEFTRGYYQRAISKWNAVLELSPNESVITEKIQQASAAAKRRDQRNAWSTLGWGVFLAFFGLVTMNASYAVFWFNVIMVIVGGMMILGGGSN